MLKIGMVLTAVAGLSLASCMTVPADTAGTPGTTGTGATVGDDYARGEEVVLRYTGEGACLRCFRLYQNRTEDGNAAFALSESGAFYGGTSEGDVETVSQSVLANCEAQNDKSSTQPCRLLMVNDEFVWEN